jgi:hypothetical protein
LSDGGGLSDLHRVDVSAPATAADLNSSSTGQSAAVAAPARTNKSDLASLHVKSFRLYFGTRRVCLRSRTCTRRQEIAVLEKGHDGSPGHHRGGGEKTIKVKPTKALAKSMKAHPKAKLSVRLVVPEGKAKKVKVSWPRHRIRSARGAPFRGPSVDQGLASTSGLVYTRRVAKPDRTGAKR